MLPILIPTCKTPGQLAAMRDEIEQNTVTPCLILPSFARVSAARNRNWCLKHVQEGELAIMLDDDISGFMPGWEEHLLRPFDDDERVVMVSARLMNPNGKIGQTCSRCYNLTPMEIEIKPGRHCILPTAAIAFRHRGHRFDETFAGSGFEDSDWCFQFLRADPNAKFIQSNRCRLVHANEMKGQKEHWQFNKKYFEQKWPEVPNGEHG